MFHERRGFTLLELIVAIAVITSGVFAIFSLFLQSSKAQRAQEGQTQALELAREGIEIVRKIRDSNWLAGCPDRSLAATPYRWDLGGCFSWDTGLSGTGSDVTAVALFDDQANRWQLQFPGVGTVEDVAARLYLFNNNVITHRTTANRGRIKQALPISRLITLYQVCRNNQQEDRILTYGANCRSDTKVGYHIKSTVRWNSGSGFQERTIEERLYNWR